MSEQTNRTITVTLPATFVVEPANPRYIVIDSFTVDVSNCQESLPDFWSSIDKHQQMITCWLRSCLFKDRHPATLEMLDTE